MYQIIGADQKEYGPISRDQVRQWIAEGRLNASTRVRPEGATDWRPLSSYPELAALLPPAASVPPPPGPMPTPGLPPLSGLPQRQVPNYLVQAILCTICCCLPFGIPAIIYAAQVNSKLAIGDYAGAEASSNNARMWCWISFGLGLLANVIGLLLGLSGALAEHWR